MSKENSKLDIAKLRQLPHNVVWSDLTVTVIQETVLFLHGNTLIASDAINDGAINLFWFGSSPYVDSFAVGTIHGTQRDLSYGYVIQNGLVYRSPLWRDKTPGWLNLTNLNFTDTYTYGVDGRGNMAYSTASLQWTCTSGSGAEMDGQQITLAKIGS